MKRLGFTKQGLHEFLLQVLLWLLVMILPMTLSATTMMVLAVFQCGTISRAIVRHFERRKLMALQKAAYHEGYKAFLEGVPMENNPYTANSETVLNMTGWFAGWLYAQEDALAK
jgi:ribosome modulation factor